MNKKLIIACCIITILYVGCSLIPHHTEFDDKAVLEDAMEMSLPNYRIIRFEEDPVIDCHGDLFNKILNSTISLLRHLLIASNRK